MDTICVNEDISVGEREEEEGKVVVDTQMNDPITFPFFRRQVIILNQGGGKKDNSYNIVKLQSGIGFCQEMSGDGKKEPKVPPVDESRKEEGQVLVSASMLDVTDFRCILFRFVVL